LSRSGAKTQSADLACGTDAILGAGCTSLGRIAGSVTAGIGRATDPAGITDLIGLTATILGTAQTILSCRGIADRVTAGIGRTTDAKLTDLACGTSTILWAGRTVFILCRLTCSIPASGCGDALAALASLVGGATAIGRAGGTVFTERGIACVISAAHELSRGFLGLKG
jgi:hypothetical protein